MTRRRVEGSRVAVIVAAVDARTTARASLGRFAEEVKDRGEVILVDASRDGTADLVADSTTGVRILRRGPGALTPELWRDGLDATDAPLVALSTAAMVPAPGWLDALLARLHDTDAAAVGGPIEPGDDLAPVDRAVYLLRYVQYLRPLPDAPRPEPPGENVLYRRDRLRGLEPGWASGFWEAEVHRALRAGGAALGMASDAAVAFHGGVRLTTMVGQRFRHARRYGAARASRMSRPERLLRVAAAPMVPAVLLTRAAAAWRARRALDPAWLTALPAFSLLAIAWAAGEALGVCQGGPRIRAVIETTRREVAAVAPGSRGTEKGWTA
jgi:hypothetical protein